MPTMRLRRTSTPSRFFTTRLAALWQLVAALIVPRVYAAELEEVDSFAEDASARMFIYVPDTVGEQPPILVAIHWCSGSASDYLRGTGYEELADRHGFIVIYPETTASDRCFDVHSDATLSHDGGSDSRAIADMVRYTLATYDANPARVYVTGTSSGAMMTNVMLGAYPEVFRAGAAFAGVPFGCFAGTERWNAPCAEGDTTKTPAEWGDLVRAAYPSYAGPRPRVQLWHGDRDEVLSTHNFEEEIKQWTNVLGVSDKPASTEEGEPEQRYTRTRYTDSAGVVQVEAMLEANTDHSLTMVAEEVVAFFGLDAADDPVPVAGRGGSGAAGGGGTVAAGSGAVAGASGVGVLAGAPGSAGVGGIVATGSGGAGGLGVAGSGGAAGAAVSGLAGTSVGPGVAGTGVSASESGVETAPSAGNGAPAAGSGSAPLVPPTQDTDGCGVAASGTTRESSAAWWLLALVCVLRRRKRS
ncbi:MAG: PHB depolymerase family esterase [Polyangiales bacterium]